MTSDGKQDEQKTERFNMFMSPSEMKAIDDWAWERRIRSKSEAIRRLVQIGLRADDIVPTIIDHSIELGGQIDQDFEKIEGSLRHLIETNQIENTEKLYDIIIMMMECFASISEKHSQLSAKLLTLAVQVNAIMDLKTDVASVLTAADEARVKSEELAAKISALVDEMNEEKD